MEDGVVASTQLRASRDTCVAIHRNPLEFILPCGCRLPGGSEIFFLVSVHGGGKWCNAWLSRVARNSHGRSNRRSVRHHNAFFVLMPTYLPLLSLPRISHMQARMKHLLVFSTAYVMAPFLTSPGACAALVMNTHLSAADGGRAGSHRRKYLLPVR